ncbi:HAD-IC family P-type ATPase [Paratractidigestivibacter sp.]|uniref:HAD-IC family P-type ATPase n=1 Tax=Paratractidigestivibacter sp. TaxID=2847316 RepID=UPI002ABDD4EA|nr:HAD-IC family P-type ATPase [Paratractidigestivibacter sp.]
MQENQPELTGLTSSEVEARVADGRINHDTDVKTKSTWQIFATHAFTLFNAVNLAMAVVIFLTGQYRNMLFLTIVAANLFIGVFQEVRAKNMVDKLTIMTQKEVTVLRDGAESSIAPSELVIDDLMRLSHGDQVPADCEVVSGNVYCDESLLTGESVPVAKKPGSPLYSGSFIESGSLVARVTKVGKDGFAAKINAEAKYVKAVKSEILATLKAIIRIGTMLLVPLGIGLFVRTYFTEGTTLVEATLSTTSAVLGMIPQGLVLLTSSVLAIATTRLGMKGVLVQQSYCVETLARVDTLCLDKTGTITSGEMEVAHVEPAQGSTEADAVSVFAAIARANVSDANETAKALLAYADANGDGAPIQVSRAVAFSSARKYSGCVTADGRGFVMGAAQFVLGEARMSEADALCEGFDAIERRMVICSCGGFDASDAIQGSPSIIGCVGIRDKVRETAPQTMQYFIEQGVELRVISGDDPRTVSAIAKIAGVPDADRYVDAATLDTPEKLDAAVDAARVFGRVTPQQKRELVDALHRRGRTVAMTGDGVNDVLALREADCSVSMASGSAAARNVSEIVLADNDFSHMPEVVAEGRRSINNLQRSASLFLVKTVFTALLALICIVIPPYPFIPIQMSLISTIVIGVPSFVLALEPNHELVSGNFLANVLSKSLPASASISLFLLLELVLGRLLGHEFAEISTVCMFITIVVGLALIYRISVPLTKPRFALLVAMGAAAAIACTAFRDFFTVAWLPLDVFIATAIFCALAVVTFLILAARFERKAGDSRVLAALVERIESGVEVPRAARPHS